MHDNKHQLFVLVIEGVFEVEGRLLHSKDGLALWNMPLIIELEALSHDAIFCCWNLLSYFAGFTASARSFKVPSILMAILLLLNIRFSDISLQLKFIL